MNIFFDLETTGLNPHTCDILTGAFIADKDGEVIDELYVELRPEHWDEGAAKVHGITWGEAINFGDKKQGLSKIFNFLLKYQGRVICHANYNNELGFYYYDWAVIKMQAFYLEKYFAFLAAYRNVEVISTHTMAKELKHTKRKLSDLCAYYGIEFNHHDARSDAWATRQLYYCLKKEKLGFSFKS